MIGTELLRELIESIILTGRVKDLNPSSLLLIAAPESGKTSVVLSKDCRTVEAFSDITGRGLHKVIKDRPDITHIVINDLVACMSHKTSVNRYTLSQLNCITEEGVTSIATPLGIETFDAGRRGIIASLTLELVKDGRYWWNKIGFTSRMLPFCYRYPADLIVAIKNDIEQGFVNPHQQDTNGNGKFHVPQKVVTVACSDVMAREIRQIADLRAVIMKEQGMRKVRQYIALAHGHALLRRRKNAAVEPDDIDFIKTIDPYVSYDSAEPLIWNRKSVAV